MTLILLEALGAGLLLVFIVWWTAFSGRPSNPPAKASAPEPEHKRPADAALPLELEKSTSTDAALSGANPPTSHPGTDAQAHAAPPPTPLER